ncbi:MAG: 1-acyl-sn-glycerol-3-phosphate acyltransferase [Propionibacteriaceae bacterium]|nr:1-acyl-sn-glycerol-3-phosphate acyltransferase [Propionibacteriaceae bacterium]
MTKTPSSDNPSSYRSAVKSSVRFVAQDVMLKSFVWSICKVQVHGLELLDNVEEPFIVIANHSSHLDAALVLGSLPRRLSKHVATGAAADYFFDKKLKGLTTSLFFNAYPVERTGSRTHKGLTGRLLEAGVPLLIFPEGTRSRTGAIGQFKPGVAALSISRGVPCLPIALVGAYAAWPYNRPVPPTTRPPVHVVIGHPLTPGPGEIADVFAQRMQRYVAELYNTTAKAYGMPTLDDYARTVALKQAEQAAQAQQAEAELAQQAEEEMAQQAEAERAQQAAQQAKDDQADQAKAQAAQAVTSKSDTAEDDGQESSGESTSDAGDQASGKHRRFFSRHKDTESNS